MSQKNDEEPEAEAFVIDRGPDREEMASDYLPGSDEWSAKTLLDVNDPAAIAALSNFDVMFPEVEDLQPLIDSALEEFFKSRTSVKGQSRQEYRDIMMSMYGSNPDDSSANTLQLALGADDD